MPWFQRIILRLKKAAIATHTELPLTPLFSAFILIHLAGQPVLDLCLVHPYILNPTVLGSDSAKAWPTPSALTECQDSPLPWQAWRDILVFISPMNIWGFRISDSQISEILQCPNHRHWYSRWFLAMKISNI